MSRNRRATMSARNLLTKAVSAPGRVSASGGPGPRFRHAMEAAEYATAARLLRRWATTERSRRRLHPEPVGPPSALHARR